MRRITLNLAILAIALMNPSCESTPNTEKLESMQDVPSIEISHAYQYDLSSIYSSFDIDEGEVLIVLSDQNLVENSTSNNDFYAIELHTSKVSGISNGVYQYNDFAESPMTFFAYHFADGNKTKIQNGLLNVSISGNLYTFILENLESNGKIFNVEYQGYLEILPQNIIQ